ncbi:FKBP-type peptidyl-prolyl cis-trans isomerase [Lysobacter sp. F60174L2]|uniref:FKBP-type peptidyl-prolyl cis-trans isomerase n=1 Tax=Lysobacter sp. F60174L2 TaxID=3459295 RepID=UPI00403E1553
MRIRPLRFVTVLLCGLLLAACADPGPPPGGSVDELQRIDLKVGTGAVASSGDEVSVHYTGWLYDEDAPNQRGQQFDSSIERGEPITFLLGAGRVIRGWDDGVAGMRVGGRRVLLIPADLGYGRKGAGGVIPPNASLVFEVELVDVKKGG